MKILSLVIVFPLAAVFLVLPSHTLERAAAQQQSDRLLRHSQEQRNQTVGRRVALVIGNSAYQNANRLANPLNDAEDMAATLRELGFELVGDRAHVNRTADQMKQLILDFGDKLANSGGVGLFYYAGHGVQSQGHNYLIPVEADILREKTLEFAAVDVNRVLAEMDEAGNGFNIVILDACRSNPFTRSWRDSGQGLAQVNAPEGTLIAYATSPGKVAGDGKGRNGIFTAELLKQIRKPGVTIEEMFKDVRSHVRAATNNAQTPWEASSLVGSFRFAAPIDKPSDEPDSVPIGTKAGASASELSYWDSIKNSTNPEDYRDYLKRYPGGLFSDLARRRIAAAIITYVNRKSSFTGDMEKEFVDFSFDYPSSWDRELNSNANFVGVEKRAADGSTAEKFVVGRFTSPKDLIPQLVPQLCALHSKTIEGFKKVSERRTVLGAYQGYEFFFTGQFGSGKNEVYLWGRTIYLQDATQYRGVILTLIATSRSRDVHDVWDVGEKGELALILNSFKLRE
jgi:hypothetical protein